MLYNRTRTKRHLTLDMGDPIIRFYCPTVHCNRTNWHYWIFNLATYVTIEIQVQYWTGSFWWGRLITEINIIKYFIFHLLQSTSIWKPNTTHSLITKSREQLNGLQLKLAHSFLKGHRRFYVTGLKISVGVWRLKHAAFKFYSILYNSTMF